MQIGKIADISPKKTWKNVPCANIRNCFQLGVAIELISSNWKVIATCADSYIKDIFFSCKRVINEWTHTRHNCELSRTHQYTRRQEVNKKKNHIYSSNIVNGLLRSIVACVSSLLLHE